MALSQFTTDIIFIIINFTSMLHGTQFLFYFQFWSSLVERQYHLFSITTIERTYSFIAKLLMLMKAINSHEVVNKKLSDLLLSSGSDTFEWADRCKCSNILQEPSCNDSSANRLKHTEHYNYLKRFSTLLIFLFMPASYIYQT